MAWLYAAKGNRWYDIEKAVQVYRAHVGLQRDTALVIEFEGPNRLELTDPDDALVAERWLQAHAEAW